MAPDPAFAIVGGPCCPTLDFVIAFWIMVTFYTLLTSLYCMLKVHGFGLNCNITEFFSSFEAGTFSMHNPVIWANIPLQTLTIKLVDSNEHVIFTYFIRILLKNCSGSYKQTNKHPNFYTCIQKEFFNLFTNIINFNSADYCMFKLHAPHYQIEVEL
jgi:hypothetical protein